MAALVVLVLMGLFHPAVSQAQQTTPLPVSTHAETTPSYTATPRWHHNGTTQTTPWWEHSTTASHRGTTQAPVPPTIENIVQGCAVGELTEVPGQVRSPNYPSNYSSNLNCGYLITVASDKVVMLTFDDIRLENSPNCKYDYIQAFSGPDESSPAISGPICPNRGSRMNFVSRSNQMFVKFVSDSEVQARGFQFTYSARDPPCGGVLDGNFGRVSSGMQHYHHHYYSNYRRYYPSNTICAWEIRVDAGLRVQLKFESFELERCPNNDFVDVFNGNSKTSPSLGRFCGDDLPPTLTSDGNTMLVVMTTDASVQLGGFRANYRAVNEPANCGTGLTDTSGTIKYPFSGQYPADRNCEWTVSVEPGQRIKITIDEFDVEDSDGCSKDYLEIRNGGYVTSPELWKSCGSLDGQTVELVTDTHLLYIRFRSDSSIQNSGFTLSYEVEDGCGSELTAPFGTIQSPNFPVSIPSNQTCRWRIQVPEGNGLRFSLRDLDLGTSSYCYRGESYLTVGVEYELQRLCGNTSLPELIIHENDVWLQFHSRPSQRHRGFSLDYELDCAGFIREPYSGNKTGYLSSPNFPNSYAKGADCSWVFSIEPQSYLTLTFEDFNLPDCDDHQFQIGAGYMASHNDSHNVQKICGSALPDPIVVHGNFLTVNFSSGALAAAEGFRIKYEFKRCLHNLNETSGTIESWNYPNSMPLDSFCSWAVTVSPGYSLVLDIEDISCGKLFLRNDSSASVTMNRRISPYYSYPRYSMSCEEVPERLTFDSNRFYLEINAADDHQRPPMPIFIKASYFAVCGGDIRANSYRSTLMSMNYPEQYDTPIDCSWTIRPSSLSQHVFIEIDDLDVGTDSSDDCNGNELTITMDEEEEEVLCGDSVPDDLALSGQTVTITFKVQPGSTGRGFKLRYFAQEPPCGGDLDGPSGDIYSPNYPSRYPNNKRCEWNIQAPVGHQVEVTIEDMEIESASNCYYDSLRIFEGTSRLANLCARRNSNLPQPAVYTSSGNELSLKFSTDSSVTYKGFHISYRTVQGCGGQLSGDSGQIRGEDYLTTADIQSCTWGISVTSGKAVRLTISNYRSTLSGHCVGTEALRIFSGSSGEGDLLTDSYCNNGAFPTEVITATSEVHIVYRRVNGSNPNFEIAYEELDLSDLCQHDFNGRAGLISASLDRSQCPTTMSYSMTVPEGLKVNLLLGARPFETFVNFTDGPDLEVLMRGSSTEDCTGVLLKIYDGPDSSSPVLGEFCNVFPRQTLSSGNELYVEVSGYNILPLAVPFVARFESVCYFNMSASSGVIESPGYPDSPYPNDTYCMWTMHAPRGSTIALEFMDFEMSDSSCQDRVELTPANRPKLQFCGSNVPSATFRSQHFDLRFLTDGQGSALGFQVKYETVCGSELDADYNGFLNHSTSPTTSGERSCSWNITTSDYSHNIYLEFNLTAMPNVSDCSVAYLEVVDREGDVTRICGTQTRARLDFRAPSVTVNYVATDGAPTSAFILRYYSREPPCEAHLTDFNGVIMSPNFPRTYPNNKFCSWNITAPQNATISLTFTSFSLEQASGCRYDDVKIYNSTSGRSRPVTLCNSRLLSSATSYESVGNQMMITFKTDSSVVRSGFRAVYAVNIP